MAHAAVVSLTQKLVRLLNPSQSNILLPKSELGSIYHDLSYWQSFLQTPGSSQSNDTANALQTQIQDLAVEFEELIRSYTSDCFVPGLESSEDVSSAFKFFQEIVRIKPKINSLTKTLEAEEAKRNTEAQRPNGTMKVVVGLDDVLEQLKSRVLSSEHDLRVIPLVGMAGIGKTTLAKELYYHPIVLDHFEFRLFLTVGPQYQSRQFLLHALDQLGFRIDEMGGKRVAELGEHLYRALYGKRYLVVLDDIWDAQVWDEIEILFPNDENGSRIIMTTRLLNVAGADIRVPLLNDDESWTLLRRMVFTSEEDLCDPQLEKIGRKIAKNCEGLPLAIMEVGKLLCKIERKVESWKEISESEDPLVITIDDGTPISRALSLSYIMLPPHLKPCFLYMGVFPKGYEVPTSRLIKLWVSEGFIETSSSKSLEKVAEEHLDDLVSRSLVLVCKGSSRGRTKTCRIHFVYRNICISEAQNEKLFHIVKKYPTSFPQGTNIQRALCFHNNTVLGFKGVHYLLESVSNARSLLCYGPQHQHPLRMYLHFPSLRVLDAVAIRFYKFPHQVVELVELRYLAITYDREIPPSISGLCNLEVLIIRRYHQCLKSSEDPVYLPMEIWKLCKLRHLQCMGFDLPDPTKDVGFDGYVILKNLVTLSGVTSHSCNRGVLESVPNLTNLGIQIESLHDKVEILNLFSSFNYLNRLESFKCVIENPGLGSSYVTSASAFPDYIRKLTLSGCGFSWRNMGDLFNPKNLEVLKLRRYAFCGPEWIFFAGYYTGLKFLLLEDLDVEHWIINIGSYFFNLRHLIIRHCYKLREIPIAIGYILTLEMVEVDDCSPSLVISAQRIQELQQQNTGNESFQLRIHSSWDDKKLKR
ncbi:putative late blight resistance protein homolog r1a-6 [Phtheirospermum japonicum]|uniref:Putative late blight resistance protein homolog r1a-6 n=1 Tax=Phtheirospermum japonicum TaxID=374723 RepID=A0A830D711_9LAMI|nr:putative late blight resistance protein homolog r1a-6 [Phtheirospermum japonicum]